MEAKEFFGRYKWKASKDSIGEGGFGKVFRAHDLLRNREVAIKSSSVGNHKFTLKREVELVNELTPHENVLRYENYYRFEVSNEEVDYAVMPFYPLGNLTSVINFNKLNLTEKKDIALGIVEGLIHLHANKVIHRDLKPSNILIEKKDDGYNPRLADFGLSKFKGADEKSVTNSSVGRSMPYAAPEQLLNDGKVDTYTDIWSLGTILYELFCGERAFNSDKTNTSKEVQIYQRITNVELPKNIHNLTNEISTIVRGCLKLGGKDRISLKEIKNLLITDNEATVLMHQNKDKVSPVVKSRKAFVSVVLILITLVVGGYLLIKKYQTDVDLDIPKSQMSLKNDSLLQKAGLNDNINKPIQKEETKPNVLETSLQVSRKSPIELEKNRGSKTFEDSVDALEQISNDQIIDLEIQRVDLQIKTNKGESQVEYLEGDEMTLYYQVNEECYLRILYLLADGSLVLLQDDFFVEYKDLGQWVKVTSTFECTAPYGNEKLIAYASPQKFEKLKTYKNDDGYLVVSQSEAEVKARSSIRGMRANKEYDITEKVIKIRTSKRPKKK